jgi:hypothetical protein
VSLEKIKTYISIIAIFCGAIGFVFTTFTTFKYVDSHFESFNSRLSDLIMRIDRIEERLNGKK